MAAALNLNIHFRLLALDGVFTEAHGGALSFHRARAPTDTEVAVLLELVVRRLQRLFERRGLVPHPRARCAVNCSRAAILIQSADRVELGSGAARAAFR